MADMRLPLEPPVEQRPSLEEEKRRESSATSEDAERYLVTFDDDTCKDPKTWSVKYKIWVTIQLNLLAFAASLGSSITAPAQDKIAQVMGVSRGVTVLSISLYVLGFAFGPLFWGPVSELWGRKMSMLPATFCLGVFSIGTAVSKGPASLFITRFFGGLFGSAPNSNVAAALGDIWEPRIRGAAMSFYAVCVVGGPTLGPTIGAAALVNPHLGWRWTEYIEAIVTFAVVLLTAIFLPEIYPPVLLARKARKMRKSTGNTAYYHPSEQNKLDVNTVVTKHLTRPLRMLTTEPIVTAIAIYASFVFGLLYLTLEVFPIVYLEDRGWPVVSATLPFIGLFVGILCALGINLGNIKRYARISDAAGGKPVPEARLQPMILGSIIFPIGLFWFGWTANPKYHWAIPTVATGFIGAGFNIIFQQCINYLVDSYGLYAASATSANTFLRSIMAAGLPLAANPMFHSLGVGPAMSILGAIAVLAIAVPFLFLKYAIVLRSKSAFAMAKGGK